MSQGSESLPENSNFLDPAFYSGLPMYNVQSKCSENSLFSIPINISSIEIQQGKHILAPLFIVDLKVSISALQFKVRTSMTETFELCFELLCVATYTNSFACHLLYLLIT